MLWHSNLDLLVSDLTNERTNCAEGGPLVHKPILDVIVAATGGANELLTNEGARCKICVVKPAERTSSVEHSIVLNQQNFVHWVEHLIIEGIRDSDLNHLPLLQQVLVSN
jgi:hypothetical protein